MEAGKLKLINEQYHLSNLIMDINIMIRERAENKGLSYNVVVNRDVPDVLIGDENRLKQVIVNLLTNGVKYTLAGFVNFTIDFGKVSDDFINLKISVKDSGIGMKQEEIDRLFEAFERLDENRNRTVEGTGLGMSIVKQILDSMDSKLDVKSVYGAGSEFSFVVTQKVADWQPIGDYEKTSEKIASGGDRYRPSFVAPEAKILAVDDTELNLRVMTGLLEPTKINIDTADSGLHALELLQKTKYDLMFIDHRMPEMDGVELLKHIKYDEGSLNRDSLAIALTANVVEGAKEMYLNAGFNDYLEKPVNSKRLENTIKKYLPKDKILEYKESDECKESEEAAETETNSGIPQDINDELIRLRDKGLINIEEGVSYAGSEELFLATLRFFRDSVDSKADEILKFYAGNNMSDYTAKVHALKSSARIIGAYDLADKAKLLEEAGKHEDMEYIKENTEDVIKVYRSYKELLSGLK